MPNFESSLGRDQLTLLMLVCERPFNKLHLIQLSVNLSKYIERQSINRGRKFDIKDDYKYYNRVFITSSQIDFLIC